MNGPELSAAAKARLSTEIPSRTVYEGAIPDGPLPAQYLLVVASEGDDRATRAAGSANVQTPYLWVYSVSRNASPDLASREAAWGAAQVRAALRGWKPDGQWRISSMSSMPAARSETLPETTFEAVEIFWVPTHV